MRMREFGGNGLFTARSDEPNWALAQRRLRLDPCTRISASWTGAWKKSAKNTHHLSRRKKRMNILITGASAGLGLGMAREFAASGHNLALCARRLDQL
jgi:hypothetical protein